MLIKMDTSRNLLRRKLIERALSIEWLGADQQAGSPRPVPECGFVNQAIPITQGDDLSAFGVPAASQDVEFDFTAA